MSSSAGTVAIVVIVLFLIAAVTGNVWQSVLVRRQRDLFVPLNPTEALDLVKRQFSRVTWAPVADRER